MNQFSSGHRAPVVWDGTHAYYSSVRYHRKQLRPEILTHKVAEERMKPELRYAVSIYWSDEDHGFIAEVPELPGCMADGLTYSEAISNMEAVIGEWIETAHALGRPIPAPHGRLVFA